MEMAAYVDANQPAADQVSFKSLSHLEFVSFMERIKRCILVCVHADFSHFDSLRLDSFGMFSLTDVSVFRRNMTS